jgi:hypothetical protein
MSKEIYESKVAKDAAKRFRMLCEYMYMTEEGEGEEAPADPSAGMDPSAGGAPADPSAGGAPGGDMGGAPTEGGAPGFNPQDGAGADPSAGMDPSMGGASADPSAGMDPSMGGMPGDPSAGMDPSMGGMPGDPSMGAGPMQPEDEVIDVEELTNSQEQTEEKVDDIQVTMEKGFEKLLGIVGKLDKMIDASTNNMEAIKREIEKRNPTPMEKLNMRAANDSYPFNVKPNDFWKEKEATSNYRVGGEDEPDAVQYTITQGDIDGVSDFGRISQELNDSDFNQNLLNIFGLR